MCEIVSNPYAKNPLKTPERINWIERDPASPRRINRAQDFIDQFLDQEQERLRQGAERMMTMARILDQRENERMMSEALLAAERDLWRPQFRVSINYLGALNRPRAQHTTSTGRDMSTVIREFTSSEPDLITKIMRVVMPILTVVVILLISYLLPAPSPSPYYYNLDYMYVPPLDPPIFSRY